MNASHRYILVCLLALTASCSTGKFLHDDELLLDKVGVTADRPDISPVELQTYVRQTPNARWFNLFKVPMRLYCLSSPGSDKGFGRFLRKIGERPVAYDSLKTEKTRQEMQKAVRNMGYMSAEVSVGRRVRKNKIGIVYAVRAGRPSYVRHVAYDIHDPGVGSLIANDSVRSGLHGGMMFDVTALDRERTRIAKLLLNNGYFRFNKEMITYRADVTQDSDQIDLTLRIGQPDGRSPQQDPYETFRVGDVVYVLESEENNRAGFDTVAVAGIKVLSKNDKYIRPDVVAEFNRIRVGEPYDESAVQQTYASMARLKALKYTSVRFEEDTTRQRRQLRATAVLTKARNQSVSFQFEGTNSAGDLGAAASMTYQHRNLFRGSESLSVKLRGAFEAITGVREGFENDNYKEYGVETSLSLPRFSCPFLSSEAMSHLLATSEVGVTYNSQVRPEFTRTLASASWSYKWTAKQRQHRLDLLDINYIYVPYKSDAFRRYLDEMDKHNSILKYSYEDQLIVRTGYTYTYNSAGNTLMRLPSRTSHSIRANIEESGNLLEAASKMLRPKPKDKEGYTLANIHFAQYVRGDFSFTQNWMLDQKNFLVFHWGMGVAYPYGNSKMLPFEKRYFSGGPNSVRGWPVRGLGPGSYKGSSEGAVSYVNHMGDIKLDLNLEYRTHLFWKFNGAVFVDAGNIWNIREYDGQEGGVFKPDRFYRQLAVAYGLGVRFDLDYLILRFDSGMKAINPMEEGSGRYPFLHHDMGRDFCFHFAVGYPF
ncbi:MAG: BamA/TamA family outer membrane protein [Bacteroidales bacterium]|nr:BamA/TamA family outer membrane protein [Bacteroidales bacterium]